VSVRKFLLLCTIGGGAFVQAPQASAATFKSLHSFIGHAVQAAEPDGTSPASGLFVVNDKVYGTTSAGGLDFGGSVFSFSPKTSKVTVLGSFRDVYNSAGFTPGAAPLAIHGGQAYGALTSSATTFGGIYKVLLSDGEIAPVFNFPHLQDGAFPIGVVYAEGALYGICRSGGVLANGNFNGTVIEVNPITGREITLHVFSGGADGGVPTAGLVYANGLLYGTASVGGGSSDGVVFAISPVTGAERVLHSFAGGSDGASPSSLVYANGLLYGTTLSGGAANAGTLFSIDPSSGAETQIYAFTGGADGSAPASPLLLVGNDLYGTSSAGGANGDGTLFRIAATGGAKTVLHDFAGTKDGASPIGALISLDGTVYGTTLAGGADNEGTIFGYTP
jgi:uncharacterized repeat protein (TIGR03803 family)